MPQAKKTKIEKTKTLISAESAKSHIKFLRDSGFAYTLSVSNYTTEILSDLYNIQFLQSMRGKKFFSAYSKIKSDIKAIAPPVVDKENLRYFQHNFKNDFFSPEVYNVDLKSAYATILYNDGFIKEETWKYISSIPKLDRLASVGMLASRKNLFHYNEKGELTSYERKIAATENFFFHCVQRTDNIMNELKFICYEDYLFTWVDGIYFKPSTEKLALCQEFLLDNSFKFSVDILKNFSVNIAAGKIRIMFDKYSEAKKAHERKIFTIPADSSQFAKDILNYIKNN